MKLLFTTLFFVLCFHVFGQYQYTLAEKRTIPDTASFDKYYNYKLKGQLDKAFEVIDSMMLIYEKSENWEAYLFYGNCKANQLNNASRLNESELLIENLINNCRYKVDTLDTEFIFSKYLLNINYSFSGRIIDNYKHTKALAESCKARDQKDNLEYHCYVSLCTNATNVLDFESAYDALFKAEEIIRFNNWEHMWGNYYMYCCGLANQDNKLDYAKAFTREAINTYKIQTKYDSTNYLYLRQVLIINYLQELDYDLALKSIVEFDSVYNELKKSSTPFIKSTLKRYSITYYFHLGTYYWKIGEEEKGEECFRLGANIANETNDYPKVATLLLGLGEKYATDGEYEKALELYEEAKSVYDSNKMEIEHLYKHMLDYLSFIYINTGKYKEALRLVHTSSFDTTKNDLPIDELLYSLPIDLSISNTNFEGYRPVLKKMEAFLGMVENQNTVDLKNAIDLHSEYYFKDYQNILNQENDIAKYNMTYSQLNNGIDVYLSFNKKYGLDSLSLQNVVNHTLNFKTSNLKKQLLELGTIESSLNNESLFYQISNLKHQYSLLNSKYNLLVLNNVNADTINTQIVELQKKILKLEIEDNASEEINIDTSFLSKITIDKVQNVLDENEAIIDILFANERVIVSCIAENNMNAVIYESDTLINLTKKALKSIKVGEQNCSELSKLYNLIVKPFKDIVTHKSKLIISADGELLKLPFDLLKCNNESLIESFAITYTPSVPLWLNNSHDSIRNNIQDLKFLGIAPEFGEKESALIAQSNMRSGFDLDTALRGDIQLAPLPYTVDEVNSIKKIFSRNSNKKPLVLVGNVATKQNTISSLSSANIIHFATHGFVNQENPYISGLAMHPNSDTFNYKDIFYHYELYNTNLNADLVVLSACKTGTGKIIEGEGVMALPRGFIYAGVPNVIASLWKVHDEKTKDLMVAFYKHLLEDKVSYAEALRLAKLDCIEKGFLPMDWAGFILIGN